MSISSSLVIVMSEFAPFLVLRVGLLDLGAGFAGEEKRLSMGSKPFSSRIPVSGTVNPVFLARR
jgi:hypothetical protein